MGRVRESESLERESVCWGSRDHGACCARCAQTHAPHAPRRYAASHVLLHACGRRLPRSLRAAPRAGAAARHGVTRRTASARDPPVRAAPAETLRTVRVERKVLLGVLCEKGG